MMRLAQVAMVATTPWDSYLIRTNVWTYPPDAVLGLRLFKIPAEEVFFSCPLRFCTHLGRTIHAWLSGRNGLAFAWWDDR